MLGAIIGDIVGSVYEARPIKTRDFPLFQKRSRFTDDTVLTVATADAIINSKPYADTYRQWGQHYPRAGYGGTFIRWLFDPSMGAYNSFGNGAAMRVSPVGYVFDSAEQVLEEARKTAEVSHNHPEGIKGAQATAYAIFLARKGASKKDLHQEIEHRFGYDLSRTVDSIRPSYHFDVTCQGSVPEAIIAFLESEDFEDAIRLAISLGGDSDTLGCMCGGIAQSFYGEIPRTIVEQGMRRLSDDLSAVVSAFDAQYTHML
jgi:ADP-ribosylglycohydrolase